MFWAKLQRIFVKNKIMRNEILILIKKSQITNNDTMINLLSKEFITKEMMIDVLNSENENLKKEIENLEKIIMPKLTDLGSFNSPEQLDDNYVQPKELEKSCDTCQCPDDSYCVGCINYSNFIYGD